MEPNSNREEYKNDVRQFIATSDRLATETAILMALYIKYEVFAIIFFSDVITELEHEGKIIKMHKEGIIWWESC